MTSELLNDIIEWDVPNWSQILKVWQPIIDTLPKDAKILAIGERNGGLSLWLALQDFHVVCTDREGVTNKAKELHNQYGVSHLISYDTLDIVNTNITGNYDIVIMKSVLGGLKEVYNDSTTRNDSTRTRAINNIHRLLKQGGYLLTSDNLKGNLFTRFGRSIKQKNNSWHYFTPSEINNIFSSFASVKISTFAIIPTKFGSKAFNRLIFSINQFFSNLFPSNANYIGISIVKK
ncbi:MAG: class I SAM-dependent methyltransferase [Bacteroidetes bacterium]|nr:class I SAM-dependent methyltransferase [Bacteroidota bacterium]